MATTLMESPPVGQNRVDDRGRERPHRVPLSSQPVFLVGAERSGTTLLRLMLDHHPQLAFQYESEYMVHHVGDDGAMPDPRDVVMRLNTDRIFQSTGFSSDVSGDYKRLVHDWLEQKRRRDGKPCVGATVHTKFDRLAYLWPSARYIQLVRDGRDVARSCVGMGWYGNTYAASDHWLEALACWDSLCDRVPPSRWLVVRYELLISKPVETLTTICHFLGLEYNDAIFDYVDESTYNHPDPKLIYQWITKMSPRELQTLEGKIGPALEELGYKLSGVPVRELTPSQQKRMYRHNDWGRRLFTAKRFGLLLFVLDNVGRRFKMAELNGWVRMQMNKIETQHLK